MRATSNFDNCISKPLRRAGQWVPALCLIMLALAPVSTHARDKADAEEAARTLAKPHEKDGFEFRAESWVKDLKPDMGKALRVQLFKGNDYRFCIAVPPDSGVHITGTVLDFEGKPIGRIETVPPGWGIVLSVKPKKTGLYAVAIRQTTDGKGREVACAVVTGWK